MISYKLFYQFYNINQIIHTDLALNRLFNEFNLNLFEIRNYENIEFESIYDIVIDNIIKICLYTPDIDKLSWTEIIKQKLGNINIFFDYANKIFFIYNNFISNIKFENAISEKLSNYQFEDSEIKNIDYNIEQRIIKLDLYSILDYFEGKVQVINLNLKLIDVKSFYANKIDVNSFNIKLFRE